jgi:phytoene desaturase
MTDRKKIVIIGAGFAGLSAASLLAKAGHQVTVLEKHDQPGGRARVWEKDGFRFDMGPSWYWMPDVFENYFALFGKTASDFYELKRLDPSYRVYFSKNDSVDMPASITDLEVLFEQIETGSSNSLKHFLPDAAVKYQIGMNKLVFKPSYSINEYMEADTLKMQLLTSMRKHVGRYFKSPKLRQLLEFPVLFLGGTAQNIPATYSLMNYADMALGTWYPIGGINEIVKAMTSIARGLSVEFRFNTEVNKIITENGRAKRVLTNERDYDADLVISNADYEYTDRYLIDNELRHYDEKYWESRTLSPSALIFYIGTNGRIKNILHHNLFFDEDIDLHAKEIYSNPQWPEKPLFYVCCPSKTDPAVAPINCENLFFLIPVAPGLEDNESIREKYFDLIMSRFESIMGESIRDSIVIKRSYSINDFKADYNAYKGNAYGLANTLMQSAFMKPKIRSKKIKNLFYTGQMTVPGPGVPPAIISGQIVAKEVLKYLHSV